MISSDKFGHARQELHNSTSVVIKLSGAVFSWSQLGCPRPFLLPISNAPSCSLPASALSLPRMWTIFLIEGNTWKPCVKTSWLHLLVGGEEFLCDSDERIGRCLYKTQSHQHLTAELWTYTISTLHIYTYYAVYAVHMADLFPIWHCAKPLFPQKTLPLSISLKYERF